MKQLRTFLLAWASDWSGRMSGAASVVLTLWATFWPPTPDVARAVLLIVAALCFIYGSYHIWVKEGEKIEHLIKELATERDVVRKEFNAIRWRILTSSLAPAIVDHLRSLREFFLDHSDLLSHKDVSDFYIKWIKPHEIHINYGAQLDLTQAQYREMMEDLANIGNDDNTKGEVVK